jgi:hypothetical protein
MEMTVQKFGKTKEKRETRGLKQAGWEGSPLWAPVPRGGEGGKAA